MNLLVKLQKARHHTSRFFFTPNMWDSYMSLFIYFFKIFYHDCGFFFFFFCFSLENVRCMWCVIWWWQMSAWACWLLTLITPCRGHNYYKMLATYLSVGPLFYWAPNLSYVERRRDKETKTMAHALEDIHLYRTLGKGPMDPIPSLLNNSYWKRPSKKSWAYGRPWKRSRVNAVNP